MLDVDGVMTDGGMYFTEQGDQFKKYNTKIINYCFYSINEANISDKIKNLLYYANNYLVVDEYDFINIYAYIFNTIK